MKPSDAAIRAGTIAAGFDESEVDERSLRATELILLAAYAIDFAGENRPVHSGNVVVVQDTSLVDPQGANAP